MKFQRISFASLSLLLGAGACSSSSHNDMASIDGDVPAMESQVDPSTRQTIQLTQDEQIPSAPFQAHGGLMNAFYFVRESHENWETISQKLYGRSDRQDLLAKWNNNRPIVVGALIYYNSPTRPEDTQQMLSFAEDFGYTLEQHVVESGDWLSKIALQKYGHIDNWREISALNPEITNPNLIQVGQSIKLSPLVVDTARVLSALIARQQNLVEQSEHVEHPQQAIEPAQAIATPSEPNEEIPAKAKTSSFDSWELLLAAFVVTCSVLLWIRRRKQLTPDHNPQFPEKTEQIRTENTARFTIIPGSAPKSSVDHAASRLPEKKIS